MLKIVAWVLLSGLVISSGQDTISTSLNGKKNMNNPLGIPAITAMSPPTLVPCTCGVFLSGQIIKGEPEPRGNPVLMHENEMVLPCGTIGNKQCVNKCLEVLVRHLSNSPALICGSIERDCHKERAYLFTKNCQNSWVNSNLSAGREYCCKDGSPYKCNTPPSPSVST